MRAFSDAAYGGASPRGSKPSIVMPTVVPPVSLVLATRAQAYIAVLVGIRETDACRQGLMDGVDLFVDATGRACRDTQECAATLAAWDSQMRARAGRLRAGSAAVAIVDALPLPEHWPQTRDPSTYCLDNARLNWHTMKISARSPKPLLISWRILSRYRSPSREASIPCPKPKSPYQSGFVWLWVLCLLTVPPCSVPLHRIDVQSKVNARTSP